MAFIYDVFHLSEESLNNSDLYSDCIQNFNSSVNYNTFEYEPGHTKEFA